MFLHNHWELMRGYYLGNPLVNTSQSNTQCMRTDLEPLNRTSTYANYVYLWTGYKNAYGGIGSTTVQSALSSILRPYNFNGCIVGDDDTPVDVRDYKLGNDRTNSFTNTNLIQSIQSVNGHLQAILTWSGTNSSGSAITIKEIGLLKNVYLAPQEWYNYSTMLTNPNPFSTMTVRHILEEPVEVASGDSGSITLTIDLF